MHAALLPDLRCRHGKHSPLPQGPDRRLAVRIGRRLQGRLATFLGVGVRMMHRARSIAPILALMLALCPILDVHAASTDVAPRSKTAVPTAPPSIDVRDAWVRWLPGTLPAAGYMTLTNTSGHAVTVVAASSPDYGDVMLHQTVHAHDHDVMTAVASLPIPAGGTVRAAPDAAEGYHWMLMQATHPIAVGSHVSLQLRLDDGSTIAVPMIVSPPTRLH